MENCNNTFPFVCYSDDCSFSSKLTHQYHLVNMNKTWTEAQSYCRETYTDLATVSDTEDYDSLMCQIRSTLGSSDQAWVGLKFNWRWSLEDTVTDDWSGEYPWTQNVYNYIYRKNVCAMMNGYDGTWGRAPCESYSYYFVCYDESRNATQTYVLVQQWMTWYQAQSYCREHYTDLAVVRNSTENQAIKDLTQSLWYYNVWIGLYRNATWSDGDTSSNYYLQYNGLNQSCATAQYSRNYNVYNTENCNNTMSFVCYDHSQSSVNGSVGNASVFCNESSMTVSVERSSIVGLLEDHLRLSDPSCSLNSNSTHIFKTLDLNSCGTQLEDDGENLIFRNMITSFDDSNDVITREQKVEIELSCVFPKKGNVSLEFLVHKIPYIFREKGFGKFTYQFEFFHNSLYNSLVDPASYPVEVDLKEMIYMEITSTTSISNTEMFVESCQATPSDNPDDSTHYSIIQNGCKKDNTVQIYPGSRSQFRFGMEAFTFIGLHDQVYISCSVILCEAGKPNTRCAEGCINGTSRRRREAVLQTTSHYISQGPLRVRRNTNTQATDATLNLNMVFIAGCLLAAVAMVCGVVIYRSRESKVKYQRIPTE
ncbi:hypothetical protein DPEC_G00229630 [Dallia pectoralis]|uniref:Uncharacterized protein n=1 Tax=Dallia pectoralis TaxID=75939 RepID=A0ACC2G1M4_DALPE|nr:hypothetical protein DPEC_G00229630 [Dallia pectoralis]